MKIYWSIFKFNASVTFKAYPLDILFLILKRLLETIFLIYFWYLISINTDIDMKSIIAYFLISGGVSEIILINRVVIASYIKNIVRNGELSNYLTKPINSMFYIYFTVLGSRVISLLIAVINLMIGIILINNINLVILLSFIVFMLIGILISISINFLIGIIFIKTNAVGGLISVVDQIIRIISGYTIPLRFFPSFWSNILNLLPFSFMITVPTTVFVKTFSNNVNIFAGFLWALLLFIITIYLWNKNLKSYEAYGI